MKTTGDSCLTDKVFKNGELTFKTQEAMKTSFRKYLIPKPGNGPSEKSRSLRADLLKRWGQGSYPADSQYAFMMQCPSFNGGCDPKSTADA